MCDQRIAINDFYAAKDYPEHLRRIRFKDPDSGRTLAFLTEASVCVLRPGHAYATASFRNSTAAIGTLARGRRNVRVIMLFD